MLCWPKDLLTHRQPKWDIAPSVRQLNLAKIVESFLNSSSVVANQASSPARALRYPSARVAAF